MCKFNWLVLAALFAIFGVQDASATTLNFRTESPVDFEDAEGHTSHFFNLAGSTDLTVRAVGGEISWDSRDGYGVNGDGRGAYEDDEIEGPERLILTFTQAVSLSSIWLSDLFIEHGYNETGWYSLDNGPRQTFTAVERRGESNGVLRLDIPNMLITSITFGAPGNGQEFALSQLEYCPGTAVPEPASCALLGAGLIGGILRRRASKASA